MIVFLEPISKMPLSAHDGAAGRLDCLPPELRPKVVRHRSVQNAGICAFLATLRLLEHLDILRADAKSPQIAGSINAAPLC
jgi:hypothetical protein